MKRLLPITTLVAALALAPAMANANGNAHERCKADEDNRQILGGLAGAVLGGVIGSQVAGRGARTEGSFIAGTIGALAGAGIADKTIDCDPVYVPQTGYPSDRYSNSTGYTGSSTYSSPAPTYQTSTTSVPYSSSSYGSGQTYSDRVTVSDHPVYSDPTYGASTVQTYSAPTTYSAPSTRYASAAPTTTYASTAPTYVSQPVVSRASVAHYSPSYSSGYSSSSHDPQFTRVRTNATYPSYRRSRGTHFHGRYSCDMFH